MLNCRLCGCFIIILLVLVVLLAALLIGQMLDILTI